MRHNRRLRAALACLAACLLLLGGALADTRYTVGDTHAAQGAESLNQLRVGWYTQPGYMEVDAQGNPSGYLYAYLRDIARQTGWTYTFISGDFANLRYQLRRGDLDVMGMMCPDDRLGTEFVLSDLAAGTTETTLFARKDSPLAQDDYSAYNGLVVGLLQGTRTESALMSFALSKGFTVQPAYYGSIAAIQSAVRTGEADAGVITGYLDQEDMRALSHFTPRNFYFGISGKRPDVARKLNNAMAELLAANSRYQEELTEKYLYEVNRTFSLTSAEQAYLAEHPVLTVAYGMDWEPVIQQGEGDAPRGVAPMMLQRLSDLTGLAVRYVPLQSGEAYDILCAVPKDDALADTVGLALSNAYLTLPITLVSKAGAAPASVAAAEGVRLPADTLAIPSNRVYYANGRACLDAVLTDAQPAAALNAYMADSLLQSAHYARLVAVKPQGAAVSICFGVPQQCDIRILSILNKLISHTTAAEKNDYIITAILQNEPINLATIADRMPPDVRFALILALSLLVLLALLLILRNMRLRRERARTAEIAAFLDYAHKVNDDVWEVNLKNRNRWRYRLVEGEIKRVPMPAFSDDVLRANVHPGDLAAVLARIARTLDEGPGPDSRQERFDCRIASSDGYRWVRISYQRMIPSPQHPACIMVFIMDVDDMIRAEENKNAQLTQALHAAEAESRAKADFATYISHEIRSPLNAVLGYLTLAKSSMDKPEQLMDCFVKSEYAANHLLKLVGDVLDMGSLDSGKMRLAQESFDITVLMETLASIYNAQAKNRGITYRVPDTHFPERYLIGDNLRVKQVIVNLLSNAMKFTPRGGSVTLSAEQEPAEGQTVRMRFHVTDTGIGMPQDFQQSLFRAFTQRDASIAGRYGGSGLGLSIARRLLDLMGGHIRVHSVEGEGTTFTVEIAFPVDVDKRTLVQEQPDARDCFVGMRLLLVEDNDMNMEIATELLKQEGGFDIDGATNGSEAVQRFLSSPPGTYDGILMDIRMPVMDGYEATRQIRASSHPQAHTVPIFAMTANAFDEDVRLALEAGMNGHISKPIDFHRVLVTLSEALTPRAR